MELPPRLWDSGQYKGLPVYEERLCNLSVGRRTTLKASVVLWNPSGHKMQSQLFQQHFVLQADIPSSAQKVALINIRVTRDHRGTIVTPDDLSQCLVLEGLKVGDLYRLTETCTGIGALGIGANYAGWENGVANEKQPKIAKVLEQVSERKVIVGDIAFGSTIGDMHRADPRPSVWAFGFSCQSFSRGGDQRGGADERAMTLPRGLHAAYLVEAPIVVMECVAEAPTYAFVKQAISQFCEATGFVKSEVILELQQCWVANRQRWWCVLSHGEIGKVPLSPLPQLDVAPTVSDFIEEFQLPEDEVMKQLMLTEHELSQLQSMGISLQDCEIKQHSPLPTALHSWGNQFQACKCECRSTALSSSRMLQRGFYGVVIKHVVAGQIIYRHPSAQETALLCGLPMEFPNEDARLELCAVGQLASPIQSSWVFTEIRRHLKHQAIGDQEHVTPKAVLHKLCQDLFRIRRHLWPGMQDSLAMKMYESKVNKTLMPEPFESDEADRETKQEGSEEVVQTEVKTDNEEKEMGQKRKEAEKMHFADILTQTCQSKKVRKTEHAQIPGAVPGFSTDPCQAEVFSTPPVESTEAEVEEISSEGEVQKFFQHEGMGITPNDLVAKRLIVFNRSQKSLFAIQVSDKAVVRDLLKAEGCENSGKQVVTTMGNILHQDAMLGMHQSLIIEDKTEKAPLLVDIQLMSCDMPRYQVTLLQHGWVAYDEMQFYLEALTTKGCVKAVPPLIITDLADVQLLIDSWIHQIRQAVQGFSVVSAILWCGHWIPFVFQQGIEAMIGITTKEGTTAWQLTKDVNCEINAEDSTVSIFPNDCGFQAFAWLSARVGAGNASGKMAIDSAESWRFLFWQKLMMQPQRAMQLKFVTFGGHGEELTIAVAAILKEHGVFGDRVMSRAKEAIDKLGATEVHRAIASVRPWVALKQLANQASPKLKLVWEDEFNVVVKSRSKQGTPVGWKRKGDEKVATTKVLVSPGDIQVPAGVFVQDDGSPVQQISLHQIGGIGKGLVVCSEDEAKQFLHEECLSSQGLAFAVVNPSSDFVAMHREPERFPASCVSTQEPMLVSAVIIQKGQQIVKRANPTVKSKIDEIPVATAKVLVYRDQVEGQWKEFQEGPLKYIVGVLKILAVCRKPGCKCESWHVGESQSEPLLDVWNRDFLTVGFKKAKPSESELFACAIRVREEVFEDIMQQSGKAGIYIEPRSDDGKSHGDKFHTVWLSKMTYNEAIGACAKAKTPAYLIRVNRRYGLKTKVEHASELHMQFRADEPMMQGHTSVAFTVGPLPWGTTRKSLQELFNQWGWQARALQPAGRSADGKGLLWNALANTPPGTSVVQMEHGDIIIVRKEIPAAVNQAIPAVEASTHTRKSLQGGSSQAKEDPWAEAASKLPSVRAESIVTAHQIQQIEKSLEEKLTRKIANEDVSMESAWEPRVKVLEEKLAKMSEVQQHQAAQTDRLASHVQSVQAQVEKQSKEFQTHLDTKLESQMNKIEALLTKRARQE